MLLYTYLSQRRSFICKEDVDAQIQYLKARKQGEIKKLTTLFACVISNISFYLSVVK